MRAFFRLLGHLLAFPFRLLGCLPVRVAGVIGVGYEASIDPSGGPPLIIAIALWIGLSMLTQRLGRLLTPKARPPAIPALSRPAPAQRALPSTPSSSPRPAPAAPLGPRRPPASPVRLALGPSLATLSPSEAEILSRLPPRLQALITAGSV